MSITLRRAAAVAADVGVSRVTEITRLDRIGIPVCVSIRPSAMCGSLCVNTGKGTTAEEARVSAFMEAIEFAFAEPNRSAVEMTSGIAADVLDSNQHADAILSLCPLARREISLAEPMLLSPANPIAGGDRAMVPAELVFLPSALRCTNFVPCFGASSNGLGAGNTTAEAITQALFEVIERDIRSFQAVRDHSVPLSDQSLPESAASLVGAIHRAGVQVFIRHAPNAFGVAFFSCTLCDPEDLDPLFVNAGYGCHIDPEIALTRAICEAAQSRLSFIHGGRDDLDTRHKLMRRLTAKQRHSYARRLRESARAGNQRAWSSAIEYPPIPVDVQSIVSLLVRAISNVVGFLPLQVTFTTPADPLQVVRVIAPGLESFDRAAVRIGKRLRDYAERN